MKRVLVLGGTGTVGSAVLGVLRERDVAATFTFFRGRERADELVRAHGYRAIELDLTDSARVARTIDDLFAGSEPPDAAIHCAGQLDTTPLLELSHAAWETCYAVNAKSAFVASQSLARGMVERGGGDIVLVGALDRAQSLPVPVAFAACQGMLSSMTMAMAKELGSRGLRINMVALGLLERGLSLGLAKKIRDDYLSFSALRRFGRPEEVARAIVWLALDNTYMNGKVLGENGGI